MCAFWGHSAAAETLAAACAAFAVFHLRTVLMGFWSLQLPLILTEAVRTKLVNMASHGDDLCFVECNCVVAAEL